MERFQLAQPTRHPLRQVVADAARRFGRKKAIEFRQMHRFLDELGPPDDGVLKDGEMPDFTYQTAGRRIGIEIRTLFDNRPIQAAARRERIVTKAQKLATGDTRLHGRRLWITFGNAPLPTVQEGAEELVRQVDRLGVCAAEKIGPNMKWTQTCMTTTCSSRSCRKSSHGADS